MIRRRGFTLLDLLVAMALGLVLIAAALGTLNQCRVLFAAHQSLAQLQDATRYALALLESDLEHAGFYGLSPPIQVRLISAGEMTADQTQMHQPSADRPAMPVRGLPAGTHQCGVNFLVDLQRPVQATDSAYRLGGCVPTASAGGSRSGTDTLTVRRASFEVSRPRAGRLQVYSRTLAASGPLLLFADGEWPGPRDDGHEVHDLEVRSYYVANDSVGGPGLPALRVKALTESGGAVQVRDEEVVRGVEDLQVELGIRTAEDGRTSLRFVAPEAAGAAPVVAVRLWIRVRAESSEPGYFDDRVMTYANVRFEPDSSEARQRRWLVSRTVTLRNPGA
jgi:type IV pilus assembly protein PilW